MAFLQIKSNNPDISYVLLKNPASGMQIKSVRKGTAFGYYDTDTSFNVYFKDSETEVSYKSHPDEDFEYMNQLEYLMWTYDSRTNKWSCRANILDYNEICKNKGYLIDSMEPAKGYWLYSKEQQKQSIDIFLTQ